MTHVSYSRPSFCSVNIHNVRSQTMSRAKIQGNTLMYKGSAFLRQRLVLSVLSGKAVRITQIRLMDDNPGVHEYEVSLIRLLDKITNGTIIELNETGTSLYFQPGLLFGGKIEHDCCTERGIGYYLEVLLMLGLFCKHPINATLRGVTNNRVDPSVDLLKTSMLQTLRKFILDDEGLDLKITKRGMMPLGGGEVVFTCPVKKQLRPVQIEDPGKVKRIRGIAYALRVSPALANRMVDKAKGVMLNFLPDVYITADQCKGKRGGNSPGFGIYLYAETTKDAVYSAERVSNVVANGEEPSVPEDLGEAVAQDLLHEIYLGGTVESACQSLAVLFMTLGPKDVSHVVTATLTDNTIEFLRHVKEFFGLTFKIDNYEAEEDMGSPSPKISLTCVGIGYTNISKRTL